MPEHSPAPTPNRAVYGFVLYLLFTTLFVIYVCWAYIPEYVLEVNAGLFYLPSKYFALYVPIVLLTGLAFTAFFIYPAINLIITPDVDDVSTITDAAAVYRCQYQNQDGVLCDNIVKKSKESEWTLKKFCSWHSGDHQADGDNSQPFVSGCDCPPKSNCLLQENENYLTTLRNRTKIPPVRDLDIADVCTEIFGN